ncbi:Cdk5rap3 protein, partial [Globisporangium splendens]
MADKRKLPIDIQYKKLLEALIDRRIVPQKWVEQQKMIRDAIALLYADVPLASDKLVKFRKKKEKHEDLHYFDCKYILECLKQTDEYAATNFFGQYTSPVMKQWDALIRQYEKNNVYAAEAARIIAQNTAYEIPFLKKSIQQNEKQVADNNRKAADLTKSIAEYKRKLELACSSIGIQGVNFREELHRLPYELPSIFEDAGKTICGEDIVAAIAYHRALQDYLQNCELPAVSVATTSTQSSSKKDKKKSAKSTQSVKEEATDESFETVHVPFEFFSAIEELRAAKDEVVDNAVNLDFEAEAAEINWDFSIDGSGSGEDVTTIDWGIETISDDTATSNNDGAVDLDTPVEIDWDISSAEVGESIVEPVSIGDAVVASTPSTTHEITISGEPTRVGLLSENEFRTRILNNLLELRTFLRQRQQELKGADNVAFANQFQGSSPLLEQQSVETVKKYQDAVDKAISQLTDKRLQQLILIKNSERYLDRHVASLEMLTKQIDKSRREVQALEDKNVDLIDATSKIQPQIDAFVAITKKLKKELELALPALFKGYKVNIVGEVNNL